MKTVLIIIAYIMLYACTKPCGVCEYYAQQVQSDGTLSGYASYQKEYCGDELRNETITTTNYVNGQKVITIVEKSKCH